MIGWIVALICFIGWMITLYIYSRKFSEKVDSNVRKIKQKAQEIREKDAKKEEV